MPHPAERPDTQDLLRGHATVGDFDLTICTDGTYFLDGGAMFGVVPKPLWEKRAPADDRTESARARTPSSCEPASIPSPSKPAWATSFRPNCARSTVRARGFLRVCRGGSGSPGRSRYHHQFPPAL